MTGIEIRNALVAWFSLASGAPVIWMHQNSPRPARPYIGLQVTGNDQIGFPYEGPVDGITGIRDLSFDEEFTLSLTIYGSQGSYPGDISKSLRNKLRRESTRQAFFDAGFCYVEPLMIQDIPSLLSPEFEPRAAMALLFRTNSQEPDEVGVIETAVIEVEFHNVFQGVYLSFTDQSLMIFADGAFFLLSDGSPQRTPILTATITVTGAA